MSKLFIIFHPFYFIGSGVMQVETSLSSDVVLVEKRQEFKIDGGFYYDRKKELSLNKKNVDPKLAIMGYDKMLSKRMKIINTKECPFTHTHVIYESSVVFEQTCVIPQEYLGERKNIGVSMNEFVANYTRKHKAKYISYSLKRVKPSKGILFNNIVFEYFGPTEYQFKLNWRLTFLSESKNTKAYCRDQFVLFKDIHFSWDKWDSSDEDTSDDETCDTIIDLRHVSLVNDMDELFQQIKI